jgi:hypothetical protein
MSTQGIRNALATLGQNVEALELKEDPADVEDLGDGVVATALFPDVHLIPGFWKIDGYSGVRAALSQKVPLRQGLNYIEFPYDWRRDNRVAARKLARLAPGWLDQWRRSSGNQDARLVLVGHSMGGLVARYFLECLEGWQYARKLITFGTPYRGSLNALDFLSNGYKKTFAGFNLADLSVLMRSFTSVYQLLPRYPCVDMGDGVLRRPGEVTGLRNIDPKKAAAALAFHYELEKAICRNQASKEYRPYTVHPIVGVDQPTKQSARVEAGGVTLLNALQSRDEGGDGTVPRPSAVPLGCRREDDAAFESAALFVPGIHGSLQNLPQVAAQVSYVLLAPDFAQYRGEPEPLSLELEDAYRVDEPIGIHCRAGPTAQKASLSIEDTFTRNSVVRRALTLAPKERVAVPLEPLPAGTYRAKLEIAEQHVSDVFLVSR